MTQPTIEQCIRWINSNECRPDEWRYLSVIRTTLETVRANNSLVDDILSELNTLGVSIIRKQDVYKRLMGDKTAFNEYVGDPEPRKSGLTTLQQMIIAKFLERFGIKDAQNSIDLCEQEIRAAFVDVVRYRFLRELHWSDGRLAVCHPDNVKLGSQTYSRELLDERIDDFIVTQEETKHE